MITRVETDAEAHCRVSSPLLFRHCDLGSALLAFVGVGPIDPVIAIERAGADAELFADGNDLGTAADHLDGPRLHGVGKLAFPAERMPALPERLHPGPRALRGELALELCE